MSSSTARRFGAKTYSRSKDSAASRAFDEIVSNKPAIKAASTHTKWGKTNFKALRESQRLKGELSMAKKPRLEEPQVPEDPFSFDADAERRRSPVKKQVVLAKSNSGQATRLPGARIATRSTLNDVSSANNNRKEKEVKDVKKDETLSSEEAGKTEDADEFCFKPGLAMSKRTYTRAPFANPAETKRKLVVEPMEVKPIVDFGFGDEEEEEEDNYSPGARQQEHSMEEDDDEEDDEVSFNFHLPQFMRKETQKEETSLKKDVLRSDSSDEESVSFTRQPVRAYGSGRRAVTESFESSSLQPPEMSQSSASPSSPSSAGSLPTAITRGPHSPRRASRYSDPKLLQEYKRMYDAKVSGKNPDVIGSFSNSTVVSRAQVKGNKGTTLIVVCKPKGTEQEKKETVQHKYFGNPSKDLSRADRPIRIDVITSGDDDDEIEEDPAAAQAAGYEFDSEDTAPPVLPPQVAQPPTRTRASRSQNNNVSTVQVRNKIYKSSHVDYSSDSVPASSQDSYVSEPAGILHTDSSNFDFDETNNEPKPVTYSSKRSYRIFKSRAPATEVKETPEEEPQAEGDPPSLDIEPPTLEPARIPDISPQASPPCLSMEDGEEDEEEVVGVDSSQDLSPSSTSNSKNAVCDEMDVESDSQSIMSEDSHDSQDDSQKSQVEERSRKIFKSKNSKSAKRSSDLRRKVLQSPKKSPTKAVYNARSWQPNLDPDTSEPKKPAKQPAAPSNLKDVKGFAEPPPPKALPKLTRSVHWPSKMGDEAYTSLRVNKEHRPLFTVVRNVKQAFEVQESGETQDFMDDVEYLLDGLQDTEPMSIRCLSCIQLAGKCTLPAFRMHLRAHGTISTIFNFLHDAHSNPSLALSTATMMYMLSKDRLNMDLEKDSLNLMLRLLEVDLDKDVQGEVIEVSTADLKELERTRAKVYELCEQMQNVGTKLDLDTISTGNLAMESLLSLTSRKAGDWFKEELRSLGALDHIVDTVAECAQGVGDIASNVEKSLPCLKKFDRCLRVLENVTYLNTDNQSYVISHKNALLITTTCSVLRACEDCMSSYPVTEDPEKNKEVKESLGYTIINCVLAILRVLLNVTHDNEYGSTKVGEQEGLMECVLLCVFSTSHYAPTDQKFDILVLCIGLLINMVEHCLVNRRHLIECSLALKSGEVLAVQALIELFCEREKAAREMEEQQDESGDTEAQPASPNKSGEWQESEAGVQWIVASAEKLRKQNKEDNSASTSSQSKTNSQDDPSVLDDEETFTQALHKAGKHMENSIIASYVALLIGCLIQDNRMYVDRIKEYLPDGSFDPMIKVLKKFLGFMNLTSAIGNTGGQPIARVIEILEAC